MVPQNEKQLQCELKRFELKQTNDHYKNPLFREQCELIKNFKNSHETALKKLTKRKP